jgi:leucyl-tRNA---protein transferase
VDDVQVRIGRPIVARAKLTLYDRFHAHQAELRGWPEHPAKDAASYRDSFVNNPVFTEEWCHYLGGKLIGVGYVDDLPGAMSAIYFFYDPDYRERSLGTWNVLRILEEAKSRGRECVYLGYFVEGCLSLAYKANFKPNQIRHPDGVWRNFLE